MGSLQNKVAIVTGGARGIGGATARLLAEDGVRVLIAEIDIEEAQANAERIRAAGDIAEVVGTDITRGSDIKAMVERAVELWDRLDILVNNAYARKERDGGALTLTESAWDDGMNQLKSSLLLGPKYAVPEMEKVGGGSIVNVSSVHGILASPQTMVYQMVKSTLIAITRQLAIDFGPLGIRANAVCPGKIAREAVESQCDEDLSKAELEQAELRPLRRLGQPIDIANAIKFLCSDEASFITGHALVVDGGSTVQLPGPVVSRMKKFSVA